MFDPEIFLKTELIKGLKNGSFTAEQVKILAFNYKNDAHISETCFNEIVDKVEEIELLRKESVSDAG